MRGILGSNAQVRSLGMAKGKQVNIPALDSVCRAICASFGICLWQHKGTSIQEGKAVAEISFLFKKVKKGAGQGGAISRTSTLPKGVVN